MHMLEGGAVTSYPTYWVVTGGESRQVADGPHLTILQARVSQERIKRELQGQLFEELQIEIRE